MKNIIWLNDHLIKESKEDKTKGAMIGGGETTLGAFIKKGKELGHNIELLDPYTIDMDKIKKADLVILSNVLPGIKQDKFNFQDIDWIIENKPFIKLEHDATFCSFRNIQCDDFCERTRCHPYWYRKIFDKAKKVIFLSPLQLKLHLKFFWKELGSKKYIESNATQIKQYEEKWIDNWSIMKKDKVHCIPPYVSKTIFCSSETARVKGTYCVVGAIYGGKGIRDILEQYESLGKNLRFIGPGIDPILIGAISHAKHTIVPPVVHKDMPSILQKYEYMIISRRIRKQNSAGQYLIDEKENSMYSYMNEGFGRIVPEALNCGIRILIDKESKEHFGAYSYGWTNEEIIDNCNKSNEEFWKVITNE